MITDAHVAEAEQFKTLGPAYFCSREVVERAMAGVQTSDLRPLLDAFVKQFSDAVWSGMQDHLLSDTEMNLQGAMYRQVDDIVKYMLSGEKWAVEKYALGDRYDCANVRAAIAKHLPDDIRNARISDLEAEVERLRKDNEFLRRMR